MDYSILKGFIIAFLIQHCTSEDVTSSIQSSSATGLHDEAPASLQEQEPAAPELVPVVAPPSLQEVQQAVQEASEKEGQGAEEVLKGLLERVVEAALGAVESAEEAKVEEPAAVTVEGAGMGEDSQAGDTEKEVVLEDKSVEQGQVDALVDGADVVKDNSDAIITNTNEMDAHEVVADKLNNNMGIITSDIPEDKESAAEMVVGGTAQETVEGLDLSPGLVKVEQESVTERTHRVIDSVQAIAEEALEHSIDSNILQDNDVPRKGDVEGNFVVQEVESEQVEAVEAEETGDGETVIEGGSIVPKVTDGSEAGEEEAALEATNSSEDEDQEVQQSPDGEPQDSAAAAAAGESLQQATELLPETPPPSPSLRGTETGGQALGGETLSHDNEILSPIEDQAPVLPTRDNGVKEVLVLPPQTEGEANELVEDATNTRETRELGLEAWKIGAICAAVLLLLETAVIVAYILRNWSKNSSSRQRVCEEGSVEPETTTGADYNDDTLPAGNGDAQNAVLDPSKVAASLQNKDQAEVQQVIPMSELDPSSTEDTPNTEPSPDRRTSAL